MERSFAITTRQAARLRGVEPHQAYSRYKRKGHWDGVRPVKLPNGRLLWNKDEILLAEGFVRANGAQPVDVRVWLAFVEEAGLPLEDSDVRVGMALLTEEADLKRIPAHTVDEFELIAQASRALMARYRKVVGSMSDTEKRHTDDLRRFIAETVAVEGKHDASL